MNITNQIEPYINTNDSLDINRTLVAMKFPPNINPQAVPRIGLDYVPVMAAASYHEAKDTHDNNGNPLHGDPASGGGGVAKPMYGLPIAQSVPTLKTATPEDSFNWMDYQKTIFKEPTLITISNQYGCGQCYCFNVLASFIDRTSIAARSACPYMSSTAVMACGRVQNPLFISACAGGDPFVVAKFLAQHGTVDSVCESMISWCLENGGCTTGTATSKELNAAMPKCATIQKYPCMICWQGQCLDNSKYTQSAVFKLDGGSIKKVFGEKNIKDDLKKNGPIVATFRVYLSFILGALPTSKFAPSRQFAQTGGIYCDIEGKDIYNLGMYEGKSVDNTLVGNHTINIVGWGSAKVNAAALGVAGVGGSVDVPYWIVRNSWDDWLDKGFCKIAISNPTYKLNTRLGLDSPIIIGPGISFGGGLSFLPSADTVTTVRNMQRTTINLNDPTVAELKTLPDVLFNPHPYSREIGERDIVVQEGSNDTLIIILIVVGVIVIVGAIWWWERF